MKFASQQDSFILGEGDAHQHTGERIRVVMEAAMREILETVTVEQMEAILAGVTMGVMGLLMAFTDPCQHRELVADVVVHVHLAANQCRDVLGLPFLEQ